MQCGENYRRLSDAMGFSMGDIVTSDQTHTTNVHVVTETDREMESQNRGLIRMWME